MNAAAGLMLEPRDFVLHMQLATFQFGDLKIVSATLARLFNLMIECLMLFFKFRKTCDGHMAISFVRFLPDAISLP